MKMIRHFHQGENTPKKDDRRKKTYKTVVIDQCYTNKELKELIALSLTSEYHMEIPLHIGIARCHPEDRYNKKVGLKIASEKVKKMYFKIDGFHSMPYGISLSLSSVEKSTPANISSESPWFHISANKPLLFVTLFLEKESAYPLISEVLIKNNKGYYE